MIPANTTKITEDDIFIQRFGESVELVILKTISKKEAEQLKQQILTALKLKESIEANIRYLNEKIESQDTNFQKYGWKSSLVESIHNQNISERNLLQLLVKGASS